MENFLVEEQIKMTQRRIRESLTVADITAEIMPLFRDYSEGYKWAVIPLWKAVEKNRQSIRLQAEEQAYKVYESSMNNQ